MLKTVHLKNSMKKYFHGEKESMKAKPILRLTGQKGDTYLVA